MSVVGAIDIPPTSYLLCRNRAGIAYVAITMFADIADPLFAKPLYVHRDIGNGALKNRCAAYHLLDSEYYSLIKTPSRQPRRNANVFHDAAGLLGLEFAPATSLVAGLLRIDPSHVVGVVSPFDALNAALSNDSQLGRVVAAARTRLPLDGIRLGLIGSRALGGKDPNSDCDLLFAGSVSALEPVYHEVRANAKREASPLRWMPTGVAVGIDTFYISTDAPNAQLGTMTLNRTPGSSMRRRFHLRGALTPPFLNYQCYSVTETESGREGVLVIRDTLGRAAIRTTVVDVSGAGEGTLQGVDVWLVTDVEAQLPDLDFHGGHLSDL